MTVAKVIIAGIALTFAPIATLAHAQSPVPGCRSAATPELVGNSSELDYTISDTGGLRVVLVNRSGSTTLSDKSCVPDAEQGALQVVVNYGLMSDTPPKEVAREMVWDVHARSQPNRVPADFPRIAVSAYSVSGALGAEAVSHDTTLSGASVFRYAIVHVFPDGSKALLSASGPFERFEKLSPVLRRIAAGLRPRREADAMRQDLSTSVDKMLDRLRGPIVDQALDACLGGALTRDAAIRRATASGFPAFQAEPPSALGEQWYRSSALANDSGQIALGFMQGPSRMMTGRSALTCSIIAPAGMANLIREKFQTRFGTADNQLVFTIADGVVRSAEGTRTLRGGGIGQAMVASDATTSGMNIQVTPLGSN